jgi:hypothetical protein
VKRVRGKDLTADDLDEVAVEMDKWRVQTANESILAEESTTMEQIKQISSVLTRPEALDEIERNDRNRDPAEQPGAGGFKASKPIIDRVGGIRTARPGNRRQTLLRPGPRAAGSQTARPLTSLGLQRPASPSGGSAALLGKRVERILDKEGSFLPERPGTAPPNLALQAGIARGEYVKNSNLLVEKLKAVIAGGKDTSTDARLKVAIINLFRDRKTYDANCFEVKKKQKELQDVKRQYRDYQKSIQDNADQKAIDDAIIEALQTKLSTVQIKITEEKENRENYELNITHLKIDDLKEKGMIEERREQVHLGEDLAKKSNELKLKFTEQQDAALQEYRAFLEEKKQFNEFITGEMAKFAAVSNIAEDRRLKHERERADREAKVQQRYSARIDRLNRDMLGKEKEAIAMQQSLESVNERLRYFEKRFQQIVSATGLTNPDAIINKFNLKEEIRKELTKEQDKKQEIIRDLVQEFTDKTRFCEELKEQFTLSKWKHVDSLEETRRANEARSLKLKKEGVRLVRRVAYFQEGLLSLFKTLPPALATDKDRVIIKESQNQGKWKPGVSLTVFEVVENQLLTLMASVAGFEDEHRRQEKFRDRMIREHEQGMSKHKGLLLNVMRQTGPTVSVPKPPSTGRPSSGRPVPGRSGVKNNSAEPKDDNVEAGLSAEVLAEMDDVSGSENQVPDNDPEAPL